MNFSLRFLLAILILIPNANTYGQTSGESSIWNFGIGAGLSFSRSFPDPFPGSQGQSLEGTSSIADKSGKLILYTDGKYLWNGDHQLVYDQLAGSNRATQSALIIPKPGSANLFYVFTVDELGLGETKGNGLNYSIYNSITKSLQPGFTNISLNSGFREDGCTERITAIRHADGTSFWIIAHEVNTIVFKIFLVTSEGIEAFPDQLVGKAHYVDEEHKLGAKGYLKASQSGKFLAIAEEGNKTFEVFRFDPGTGRIFEPIQLDQNFNEPDFGAYGVEFSPSGRFLFGSNREKGIIYRWDLTTYSVAIIQASQTIIRQLNPDVKCGALLLAQNDKIYVAMNNQSYLGVINSPDRSDCNFRELGASLNNSEKKVNGICGFGLPNMPADFMSRQICYTQDCSGETTRFYLASEEDMVDGIEWTVDDQQIAIDPLSFEGYRKFAEPGSHVIKCRHPIKFVEPRTIWIHPTPTPDISNPVFLCGSPVELVKGNWAFWSWERNGLSDTTRWVSQVGNYAVTFINYEGCRTIRTAEVIQEPGPEIDWIRTVTKNATCKGEDGRIEIFMKESSLNYSFKWNDSKIDSRVRENLKPGIYDVTITSTSGCPLMVNQPFEVKSDANALNIVIDPQPAISPVCTGTEITLTASGADTYQWVMDPPVIGPVLKQTLSKTQQFEVVGKTSNCTGSAKIEIEVYPDYNFDLGSDKTVCEGSSIEFMRRDFDYANYYTKWNWSNETTSDHAMINSPVPNDRLILEVTDINKCVYKDDVGIFFKPKPVFHTDQTGITCIGQNDGSITIVLTLGNISDFEYTPDGVGWSSNTFFQNLKKGNYPVQSRTVSANPQCYSQPQDVEITEPNPLQVDRYEVIRRPFDENAKDGVYRIWVSGGRSPYLLENCKYETDPTDESVFTITDLGVGITVISIKYNDCQAITHEIDLKPENQLINALSPNDDTINDTWLPPGFKETSLVRVFSSTGTLVFKAEGKAQPQPWNGRFLNMGKDCPAGTYFYILYVDTETADAIIKRNTITIVR